MESSATRFFVKRYSHHVVITGFDLRGKRLLDEYSMLRLGMFNVFKRWDGTWEKKLAKVYAAARKDRAEYRFHIYSWPSLSEFLMVRGIAQDAIIVEDVPLHESVVTTMEIRDGKEMFDYQLPASDYIVAPGKSKLLVVQTGKGKSRILMHACTRLQKRTVLILKPMYIQRWLDDLMESKKHDSVMKMKPGELMVVRGSADLRRLLELAVKGELTAQFIIISNKTMYNYIETYNTLNTVEGTYPVPPGEFFQTLKAAYRAIDEYHQDFHLNFILDLYTHCEKVISLSATMTSDKPFINKMYNLAMPVGERFTGISYDRYIAAYAMYYRLRDNHPLRWLRRGRTSYSHTAFEESLMKHKPSLKRYLDMIIGVVRSRYCQIAAPGQKMLIFCATVEFCGVLRDALRDATIGYDIRRYTSDDSYDNLIMADIAVSTLQSAGTAVDIPGLRVTLMTVALMSQQANEQALGRLRKLRMWPDVTPEFYYLVCRDIESHMNYDNAKKVIFLDKVLSLKEIELSDNI